MCEVFITANPRSDDAHAPVRLRGVSQRIRLEEPALGGAGRESARETASALYDWLKDSTTSWCGRAARWVTS